MKHIISLSLKYIRRQKLRTFLTFMCIMLSAFILATVCVFGSSGYTTMYNTALKDDGTWELEISNWIKRAKDPEKARDIAIHHAVTSDYYTYDIENVIFTSEYPEVYHRNAMFEVSDGKHSHRVTSLAALKEEGNQELRGYYSPVAYDYDYDRVLTPDITKEGVFVPAFIRDMGYSVGDTVTLTIRPMTAVYDEDSEIIKEVRENLLKKYGTQYTVSDPEYDELPKDLQKKACKSTIFSLLNYKGVSIQAIPLADIQYLSSKQITFTIAGFIKETHSIRKAFIIQNGSGCNFTISDLVDNNNDYEVKTTSNVYLRLNDNCDYDDALKMLFTDIGHDYDNDFYNATEYSYSTNDLLLALEMKSPYAMYKEFAGIAVPVLLVLLLAWFVSRFVIDCTFEMAVQERSSHFAALRIIGASKGQIAAIVFIEAIFYCLTAVPLGIATAILLCRSSINALNNSGIDVFEFSAKPAFIALGAFLTIIAIFISAYTSAMWAARKLSPAEALNFGKPRSKKKKKHIKKSKLDLSSKKFIRRYTKKNIKSAKSRFIIATINMALGVLMFTFSAISLIFIFGEFKEELGVISYYGEPCDFQIEDYYSSDPKNVFTEIDKYFGNKEIFSECNITSTNTIELNTRDGSERIVAEKLMRNPPKKDTAKSVFLFVINENLYKKYEIDTITGMSYQEFIDQKGALYNNSTYGEYIEWKYDDDDRPIEQYETSYYDLKNSCKLTVTGGNRIKVIGKVSCRHSLSGLIIPLENSADYNMDYNIGLTVNGSKHYKEALRLFNEFTEKNNCEMIENLYSVNTGLIDMIFAFAKIVLIFLVSIWLVGILSMINSVNTSVLNRSRELMMLRSVGMTRKQLRRSILLETFMFSATAAISGTLLGVIAARLTFGRFNLHELTTFVIPVVIISLTLNVIIAMIASIPAIHSLGRVESIAQASNE